MRWQGVMPMAWSVFFVLLFPGLLFTAVAGLAATWVDRKVTARLQWRVGPPLAQPLWDILKLMGKEVILPRGGNHGLFLAAPLFGFAAAAIASAIVWLPLLQSVSFVGDVIVAVYLLVLPSIALMLGALASGNPLAATGASREMKLVLSYELPFLLCLAVAIVRSGFSISLTGIAAAPVVGSVSGALAFAVSLLCIQAKLGFVPFDVAEAETEIIAGTYVEYSGAPLAVFKLTQAMLLVTLPVFLSAVFLGGLTFAGWGILWSILKIVGIIVLVIVIKNTNPRVRIDQAVRFFWRGLAPLAAVALALALVGRATGIGWL
jgi:NADH-quinone oxidoreductase subunit H